MSNKPEPLSAILAEMRKAVVPMICGRPKIEAVTIRDVLQWADRIEAAADRMVDECRDVPSNAAALREALKELMEFTCNSCERRLCEEDVLEEDGQRSCVPCGAILKARAALAAPVRNCDKFQTPEEAYDAAVETWNGHLNGTLERGARFPPEEGGDHA